MRRILPFLAALAWGTVASAQFYQSGTDPFGAWSTANTPHYRILYPKGLDSLARSYVLDLEKWQPLVGISAGMSPQASSGENSPSSFIPITPIPTDRSPGRPK